MFPVVPPPRVRVWFAVVCRVPFADRYVPPATPAESDAVGVPPAIFRTANFALAVDVPPRSKSSVVIFGLSVPFASVCVHLDAPDPVCAIVIEPAPLVIDTPAPAVRFANVYPVPLPINSWPLVGVPVTPVPPLAIPSVPLTSALPNAIALEESIPVEETWAIPVDRLLIWTLPALLMTNFVAPLLDAVKRSPLPD